MDFLPARRRTPTPIDLTSLIDVVFLLLIFFMVSTRFIEEREEERRRQEARSGEEAPGGMTVELPRSGQQDVVPAARDVTLHLGRDGRVFLGEEELTLEQLPGRLRERLRENPDVLVVLRADRELAHGRVVSVMDLARDVGLVNFAIATEGEAPGSAQSTLPSPGATP